MADQGTPPRNGPPEEERPFGWAGARRRMAADPPAPSRAQNAAPASLDPQELSQIAAPPAAAPQNAPSPLRPSRQQMPGTPGRWGVGEDGLARAGQQAPGGGPPPAAVPEPVARRRTPERAGEGGVSRSNPALDVAKLRLHELLIEELEHGALEGLPPDQQRDAVTRAAKEIMLQEGIQIGGSSRDELIESVADEVLGLGPLEPLLRDPTISEIMVNDIDRIFYERDGRIYRTAARFRDKAHVMRIIERIVAPIGRRIDESSPMVDARLPDGSRVNITIPPASPKAASITIRKFRSDKMKMADLIAVGAMSEATAEFLAMTVRAHLNIIISGGTGSGKTTLLNALSAFIPNTERIITVEDPSELRLQQDHVITLEARPASMDGRNQIKQRDLVKNCLRMRPDRIIVGEVRGEECFDMLQAMNTGHDGSISTVHANNPRDAIARLENMVLMAGMELPARAIREQVSSAINVFIQVSRLQDGSRKITHVTEVSGMEGDTITLQDIFLFKLDRVDEDGKVRGSMQPTGVRPGFLERFKMHGIEMPNHLFIPDPER